MHRARPYNFGARNPDDKSEGAPFLHEFAPLSERIMHLKYAVPLL